MQRCCSGSGRAHTQAPSPATATATATAAAAPGQQRAAEGAGRRGGRPRGLAAWLAPAHHLRQRPPAPANILFSPQVGANRFCLLPPCGSPGRCYGKGLRAQCPCNLGGAEGEREPQTVGWGQSDFSSQPHDGLWDWRSPPPCLCGWHPAGPWQAKPSQEAGPQQCVQEFKPLPAGSSNCLQRGQP